MGESTRVTPKTIWNDVSPMLRWLAIVMWTIGTVLIALGVWIDGTGWWSNRPFLSNLSSSLAGVFFATPFALIVVQRISASETERVERKASAALAARATEQLRSATVALVPGLIDEARIMSGVAAVQTARACLLLDAAERHDAYYEVKEPLDDLADWLDAFRPQVMVAAGSIVANWSVWKDVIADRVYVHELEHIDFELVSRGDALVHRLRELSARVREIPSADELTGSRDGSETAAGKRTDEVMDRQLEDLADLFVCARDIATLVAQLQQDAHSF
jgi:hypothetical protein